MQPGNTGPDGKTNLLMNKKNFFLMFVIFLVSFTPEKEPQDNKAYSFFSLQPVPELLTSLFKEKDIVFLGETHRIKQQVEFVSSIIPLLQHHGIHLLFYEFINYSDTKRCDSILNARNFNEKLIKKIFLKSEWDWTYTEYLDNFKSAWIVNQQLKPGETPFRIIGLMPDINYSVIQTQNDWHDPDKLNEFWNCIYNKTWLEIIESEALNKNKKALVYCGFHHAFTKFHHPIVSQGKFIRFETDREGNQCFNKYPTKVATAIIYTPISEKPDFGMKYIRPFNGVIDSVIKELPENMQKFGFLTNQSSLGSRHDSSSYYSMGYGSICLKGLADAIIVLGPVCNYQSVTLMNDFIDENDLEDIKIQAFPYNWIKEWTVKSCNDSLNKWHKEEIEFLRKMTNCN